MLFHTGKGAVQSLRVCHLGAGFATLEQFPLGLGAYGPFRLQEGQVLGVEFLIGKQGHRREIIRAGGTHRILATLALRAELAKSRVFFLGLLLNLFHSLVALRSLHRGYRRNVRVRMEQACQCHPGKGLIPQGIVVGIFRLG